MTSTKHRSDTSPFATAPAPLSPEREGLGVRTPQPRVDVRSPWPLVPLGEILRKSDSWIEIDPNREYSQVTVRLWGKGVTLRGSVQGAEIAASRQLSVRPNQFILSRIDARNGAFGLVPQELDGAVVSNDFPTFDLEQRRVIPEFLAWMSKTRSFVELCRRASEGTTNRVRLKEDRFLATTIPLPPLAEQRRIVARIEALAGRIAEARRLRREALAEAEALWKAALNTVWSKEAIWATFSLDDMARTVSGQVDPQVEPYINLPHINGESMESGTCRLLPNFRSASDDQVTSGKYHFHGGAVLYSKIRPYLMKSVQVPFEGICSADVYAFEDFDTRLLPRFFMYSLISPRFTCYAVDLSGRTRMPKLNQSQLFGYSLGVPSLDEQQHIVDYLDGLQSQLDALKRHQIETAAELDALLPAVLDRAFRGEL